MKTCFENNWAVGAGTPQGSKLVNGHAFSVINVYDIKVGEEEI